MNPYRTGILGGTFNPIHNQHLLLAETAFEQLALDKVLLIPSGISYLKEGTNVLPASIRYEMCTLAAEGIDHIEVSDIEIRREGNSYTCDTIRELKEAFPDNVFYFIIGADTLFMMDKWRDPGYIFANCTIAVAARLDGDSYTDDKIKEKADEYKAAYDAEIRIINIDVSGLSSSMIRKKAAAGEDIRAFVPEAVAEYIEKNNLYR